MAVPSPDKTKPQIPSEKSRELIVDTSGGVVHERAQAPVESTPLNADTATKEVESTVANTSGDTSVVVTSDKAVAAPETNNDITKQNEKESAENDKDNGDDGRDEDVDKMARILARRYYWRAISAGCLVIGSGLLFLSMNLRDTSRQERKWTRR